MTMPRPVGDLSRRIGVRPEHDNYLVAAAAVAAHLDTCLDCPAGRCEAGLDLLRADSAAWTVFEESAPEDAARYALASGGSDAVLRAGRPFSFLPTTDGAL